MKKRYSEYVRYNYSKNDLWFNPHVEWDTTLFIDPMLLKRTKIPEFINSYKKIINFFSNAIVKLESNIPQELKKSMVHFEEVKEANLGYSYDSNIGSGLTGKTALSVLANIKEFVQRGLFALEDFAEISLFDKNVSSDRITDMIINIIKNDFIDFSCRIALEHNFPLKKIRLKREFNFTDMRWEYEMTTIPFIVNEKGLEVPVLFIPKEFLVTNLYCEIDNFITWMYHNEKDYIKETFDFNLKNDISKNRAKIIQDILKNNRKDILQRFANDSKNFEPYDLDEDPNVVNNIYELAQKFYLETKDNETNIGNATMPVKDVAELLISYLQNTVTDKKAYIVLTSKHNTLISEPQISKFVHVLFDARIQGAGYNVDISPETNAGHGPVDFKISRGTDKILIENKISSNPKLLECIDEDKQIHTYLKQENCKDAYLLVFFNKEKDIDKINTLIKKSAEYKDKYNITVKEVDCVKKESASHR